MSWYLSSIMLILIVLNITIFKKAVLLTKDNKHLHDKGKSAIIGYKKEMQSMTGKWIPGSINSKIKITQHWLLGFIDAGVGEFSTIRNIPRFKLESHIIELELYNKIKEFLGVGKLVFTMPLAYRENSNPTIVLEINKVNELRDILIPLMCDKGGCILLKTLKAQDFSLWLKLVDMYYKGYHSTSEGKHIFDAIKLHINKYRLTTNVNLLNNKARISITEIESLLTTLYLSESPYEIKQGIRYIRNTNKLVSEHTKIVAVDVNNNRNTFKSMFECADNLNISRSKIKQYLNTGKSYKGYIFVLG